MGKEAEKGQMRGEKDKEKKKQKERDRRQETEREARQEEDIVRVFFGIVIVNYL